MHADLILTSSAVFTGRSDKAEKASVVIADGRILYVGDPETARAYRTEDTEVRDLGDAFVMPGMHDSHLHFFHSALYSSPLAESYLGKSEEDCVARLAPLARRRPEGSWLLTQGWREYRWNPARTPTKASLDAAYPDRPVAMYSGDAHTLWVNSRALEELGLDDSSVPPAGGSYDKDEHGRLTGVIREAAAMELMPKIVGAFTTDELLDAYRGFIRHLNENGITSVCDMSLMAHPGLDFVRDDLFEELERRGELTVRVNMFPTLLDSMERFEEMNGRMSGDMLRTPGFKQFFDGVSSQHTAFLHDPYSNARFEGDRGRTTVEPQVMEDLVMKAAEKGRAVRIHAIGDEAIHLALDIFEEAGREHGMPREGRNCLEHLENFQPDDIARLAKIGVVAAVQPCHMTLDPGGPERDLGPERVPYMWPFRRLLDSGAVLAFGTDSPVTDIDSMNVVYTAVTRKDAKSRQPEGGWLPAEKITVAEALRAYTLGSAVAAGRDGDLGTLEAGKLADIAVLDRNLLEIDPEEILGARVLATFVGGVCVFDGNEDL